VEEAGPPSAGVDIISVTCKRDLVPRFATSADLLCHSRRRTGEDARPPTDPAPAVKLRAASADAILLLASLQTIRRLRDEHVPVAAMSG
jgi:3-methyl-2-oxobutanoate hydroxymethyltransferase